MKSYVYILPLKDRSKFKIGKANNIYSRIKTLQKHWGEFDLAKSFILECNEQEVFKIEKNLHFIFKENNLDLSDKYDGYSEFFSMDCFHLVENAIKLFLELKDIVKITISEKELKKELYPDNKSQTKKLPYNLFLKYCFEEMNSNSKIVSSADLDFMYIEFKLSYLIPKLNVPKEELNNYIESIIEKSNLELNQSAFQIFNRIKINKKEEVIKLYYSKNYHLTILSFLAYDNFSGNSSFQDLYIKLYKGKYTYLDQAVQEKQNIKKNLDYFYKSINQKISKEDIEFSKIFIEKIKINPFKQNYIELSEFEFNKINVKSISLNCSGLNYRLYSEVKRIKNQVKIYFNPLDHCFIFLSIFENQNDYIIRELLLKKYIDLIKGFNEKSYLDLFEDN